VREASRFRRSVEYPKFVPIHWEIAAPSAYSAASATFSKLAR
jgi:hypothetical protein